ncbi:potassium-transporting ATPase subunit B [Bifidobacterium sp. DSM 109958]|uniref:Potassium-transporting ATPase ATP-binding subunit n=3 Tax=Bifidobacterium TaxID=1678 RepID=A0A7Y0HW11_9BIFI|nr:MULTISPECIES: potassium-transporting ATPase subunit KdpB [Bifidobacterium]MBT1163323.1 potassium-transporting ATPase subunit KdpB [Bifidobacterium felsineum]MBT1181640.1 potassium-transporting ATPase subunit KdpB [Bifidobacterium sp. CP2]MBW3093192.1 potassium-transporting ATPase subunit KdpB [Bifidobacterium miconis]NMM97173.1 potassium-transporting ATPase subunit B [Bifidobacterium sp. DSM 109959]NMN00740.1 potassium-transporting ATPase subunit B [Bifidobacterium sp. DSM 109958]
MTSATANDVNNGATSIANDVKKSNEQSLGAMLGKSLPDAFRKFDPRNMWHNPVMFIVWVGAAFLTLLGVCQLFDTALTDGEPVYFTWIVAIVLWATVLFANLAEAVAEGRGKAQADALRKTRTTTPARLVKGYDEKNDPDVRAPERGEGPSYIEEVPSSDLKLGDVVVVSAGELIPGDGDIISGIASVDESAITGESAPVIRESGGDRSSVTGGTRVLSDRIVVRITQKPGESFVDKMIALVEGANRQKTPNEIALDVLLSSLTIIFLVVVLCINPQASAVGASVSLTVLVALLVCLIPTTIGALLSAIGIAGMDRLVQRNVLATSGRAIEAAGDVTTLLLDKTGTITYGNRQASEFHALPGIDHDDIVKAAALSSLADATPEGQSIVALAKSDGFDVDEVPGAVAVPFTAETRMSGLDLPNGDRIRKGATSAVEAWIDREGGTMTTEVRDALHDRVAAISGQGGTPLVVAEQHANGEAKVLGVVQLKDVVKKGLKERFADLRKMGIRTVMVTGDNPLTAKAIAKEAGVDDFIAEAKPEDKLAYIKKEQAKGQLVAMTGDGTNDAPALAQSDVGVAMNSGTSAAKEAGNMVDLDSDPTKLIDIVAIGKQLLITRGALTTFSIANDVAKYFAIIPAMFMEKFPGLGVLNIMGLHSSLSAVLSAIIFNAIIIVLLIPLALKGVKYRAEASEKILGRNLKVYGLGGIIAPFVGIWIIDLFVRLIPGF